MGGGGSHRRQRKLGKEERRSFELRAHVRCWGTHSAGTTLYVRTLAHRREPSATTTQSLPVSSSLEKRRPRGRHTPPQHPPTALTLARVLASNRHTLWPPLYPPPPRHWLTAMSVGDHATKRGPFTGNWDRKAMVLRSTCHNSPSQEQSGCRLEQPTSTYSPFARAQACLPSPSLLHRACHAWRDPPRGACLCTLSVQGPRAHGAAAGASNDSSPEIRVPASPRRS